MKGENDMDINIEDINFKNLNEKLEYLEEVSNLYWKEWGKENGDTIEGVIYRTKHCLNTNDIPRDLYSII